MLCYNTVVSLSLRCCSEDLYMIKMMRYFLIITTILLIVERSSAQLDGDPPPLPDTGNQPYLCQFLIIIIHNNNYRCEVVSW